MLRRARYAGFFHALLSFVLVASQFSSWLLCVSEAPLYVPSFLFETYWNGAFLLNFLIDVCLVE